MWPTLHVVDKSWFKTPNTYFAKEGLIGPKIKPFNFNVVTPSLKAGGHGHGANDEIPWTSSHW